MNTCSNCKKPFQEVTFLTDDPPIDLIKHNENILIKDENENLKPVEIFFPISENDQCILQSNLLPESSLPQLKAQLGNVATGTIKVTKRQNITVRTGSGKESVLAYYCKFPLHTKDVNGRQYIFHIPVWVVQF